MSYLYLKVLKSTDFEFDTYWILNAYYFSTAEGDVLSASYLSVTDARCTFL